VKDTYTASSTDEGKIYVEANSVGGLLSGCVSGTPVPGLPIRRELNRWHYLQSPCLPVEFCACGHLVVYRQPVGRGAIYTSSLICPANGLEHSSLPLPLEHWYVPSQMKSGTANRYSDHFVYQCLPDLGGLGATA
jgi:hypothetical protein